MAVQWVHLGAGQLLVASSRGAWIQRPEVGALGLGGAMPPSLPATRETTRRLLDGAIAAAERAAPLQDQPPLTPRRWAFYLVCQWHCAHHSVALLPGLIERYESAGRADLAGFAHRKLEEEQGHDQFPLDDLRALGYDPEAMVQSVSPAPSVRAGLDYARACARAERPVEFLGYVYALERRILRYSEEWFARVAAALPPGVQALSGIRAHVTEFDAAHVDEAVTFIAGLPAEDRTLIALGSYRSTRISCEAGADEHPTEAELDAWLAPFRREPAELVSPERQGEAT